MEEKAYLTLANGRVFCGKRFGATGEVSGEIVFATGMTGYVETLSDPSYFGQIVVQTFPLIGNYGVIPADFESAKPQLKAYVVREWCQEPSNFRSEGNLDTFLKEQGIIGLFDVDTRELTRVIREAGVMNARISSEPLADVAELQHYRVAEAVTSVSCQQISCAENSRGWRVVLWDLGAKDNIQRELLQRGCQVITVPASTTAAEILALKPEGLMLSNGPGDPQENEGIIQEIKQCCAAKLPIFGICLGHQLLALSQGAQTFKLKYGHRGANQPVKELATGRVYISSQNHGYAVESAALPAGAKVSFNNANDQTCEGIEYETMPAFSVQFHPEACSGPRDTRFLFDRFIAMMEGNK